jgi:hypothetical protein
MPLRLNPVPPAPALPIIFFDKRNLEKIPREELTDETMTRFGGMALNEEIGSRLCRLPFVLLLTVGLLFSLIHCAGCGPTFAQPDSAVVMTSANPASSPDTPEPQLPCHSGHCFSHVTAQHAAVAMTPADPVVRLVASGREQFPAALAGLPLFKPPCA